MSREAAELNFLEQQHYKKKINTQMLSEKEPFLNSAHVRNGAREHSLSPPSLPVPTHAADKGFSLRTMPSVCSLAVMVSPAELCVTHTHTCTQTSRVCTVNHISCLHLHTHARTRSLNLSERT